MLFLTSEKPALSRATKKFNMFTKIIRSLLFSSLTNLEDFKADPEAYWPAFDGNCAYGIAFGMKAMSDPEVYDIVDGRLYLQMSVGADALADT